MYGSNDRLIKGEGELYLKMENALKRFVYVSRELYDWWRLREEGNVVLLSVWEPKVFSLEYRVS